MCSFDRAYGLAVRVQKEFSRPSGYKPAVYGEDGEMIFGELRLRGFAAALRLGFAKSLVIVGGSEVLSQGEPSTSRAWAIHKMMVNDHSVDSERVTYATCDKSNTEGNVWYIRNDVNFYRHQNPWNHCAVITSYYHIPRARMMLDAQNMWIPVFPAEAFLLLEDEERGKGALWEHFAKKLTDPLAGRMMLEIQGCAALLRREMA